MFYRSKENEPVIDIPGSDDFVLFHGKYQQPNSSIWHCGIFDLTTSRVLAKLNVMLGDTGSLSKIYLEEVFLVGDFGK